MSVLNLARQQIWAMKPDTLDAMFEILRLHSERADGIWSARAKNELDEAVDAPPTGVNKPESLQKMRGESLDGTYNVYVRDGVAIIPIVGPIFRYGNYFAELCGGGAVSTQILNRDITAAVKNPNVRAVILEIDSPGGEATSINEIAANIRECAKQKPIIAYGDGMMASAAYWLASACSEIVLSDLAIVGSIGVVFSITDGSEARRRSGYTQHEIVSKQSPKKRPDFATEEGRALIQTLADDMGEIFVAVVAQNRGVTAETVLSDFGQGDVMIAARAVAAGMADRIDNFENLLAEVSSQRWKKPRRKQSGSAAENNLGANNMNWKQFLNGFFGSLSAEEKLEAADLLKAEKSASVKLPETETVETPATTAAETQNVAATQNAAVTPDAALIAENKKLAAENARLAADKIEADVKSFVAQALTANKILPKESEDLTERYLQAVKDDAALPLSSASRVERLKTEINARPPHKFTAETISAASLKSGSTTEPISTDREKELLGKTPLGKRALTDK